MVAVPGAKEKEWQEGPETCVPSSKTRRGSTHDADMNQQGEMSIKEQQVPVPPAPWGGIYPRQRRLQVQFSQRHTEALQVVSNKEIL